MKIIKFNKTIFLVNSKKSAKTVNREKIYGAERKFEKTDVNREKIEVNREVNRVSAWYLQSIEQEFRE